MSETTNEVAAPHPKPVARWIALGVAVVVLGLVALLATRPAASTQIADSPLIGKPGPEIAGVGVDGKSVRLSSLRGRYVVVNFFATWCVPCQREHPELVDFAARHAAKRDATVLAVIFDDEAARVRTFMTSRGGTWPVVTDTQGQVSLDYGVRGPPESFLIDPDGTVLTRIVGEVDADGLDRLLRQAESRS